MERKTIYVLPVMLLAAFIFGTVGFVQGLYDDEIILTLNWNSNIYYQGDSGSVTISLQSTCGNELEFTWIGLHFAWMQTDYFYRLDLSTNPIKIASGGSCTFSAIAFDVTSDAYVGWNGYYVRINYNEHHWYGWSGGTWTSNTYQLNIHSTWEKTYNELRPQTNSKIQDAQNSNFESPDAKSYLQQALTSYNLAATLASQGKWQEATSNLQDASNRVDQAIAAETNYSKQQSQQVSSVIVGAVIGGLVLIVVLVAFLGLRRKRKAENPKAVS